MEHKIVYDPPGVDMVIGPSKPMSPEEKKELERLIAADKKRHAAANQRALAQLKRRAPENPE